MVEKLQELYSTAQVLPEIQYNLFSRAGQKGEKGRSHPALHAIRMDEVTYEAILGEESGEIVS